MKDFIKKHKWLLGITPPVLILLVIVICLIATDKMGLVLDFKWSLLSESLSGLERWLLSGSLLSLFVFGLFTNWVSSVIYGYLFPSTDRILLKNSETLISTSESIFNKVTESEMKIDELLQKSNLDSRDIERYIKELTFKDGIDKTQSVIQEWYQSKRVSLEEKELLSVVIKLIYEHNDVLALEINKLKANGERTIAEVLENIQLSFSEGNADKIKDAYFSNKEKLKKENVEILKNSIKATETLYAIDQTKALYQELILLEPNYYNEAHYAQFLIQQDYIDESVASYEASLAKLRVLVKEKPSVYELHLMQVLNCLASIEADRNEFPSAIEMHSEALTVGRTFVQSCPSAYLPEVARTLTSLAKLDLWKENMESSIEKYGEALTIFREQALSNPKEYLPYVAHSLNKIACLHVHQNEFSRALEEFEESMSICRKLNSDYSVDCSSLIATNLCDLANLNFVQNDVVKALENVEKALVIVRGLAKENPRRYLPSVASVLNSVALYRIELEELDQAFIEYEESLGILKALAAENPKTYLPDLASILVALSNLYCRREENQEAYVVLKEAFQIRRDLFVNNPSYYRVEVAYTAKLMALLLVSMDDYPLALELFDLSLSMFLELVEINPKAYEIEYASILVLGVCQFEKDRGDFVTAGRILERYPDNYQAGRLREMMWY